MRNNPKLCLAVLLLVTGCTTNPLAPPTAVQGPGGPPNPGPCPTCPDTTTPPPPPGVVTVYTTASARIHEAQSHATLATVTVTATEDSVRFSVPVRYETGKSQSNEHWHAYLRATDDFTRKYDFTFRPTGTPVVPDPTEYAGRLTRTVNLGRVPPGTYDLVVQQDLPNGHHPGESDIAFDPGTATVFRR